MNMMEPQKFLDGFGRYCFGDPERGYSDQLNDVQRLGRKFAWFESHFANMVVDYVDSGAAGEALPPDDWIGLREQRKVDVVLVPGSFQRDNKKKNWGKYGPLHMPPLEKWTPLIAIETKIIANLIWKTRWKSTFNDLDGIGVARGKPPCDYALACMYEVHGRPPKSAWYLQAYESFKHTQPVGKLVLQMTKGQSPEDQKYNYLARWPKTGVVEVPGITWNDTVIPGSTADIFLILLERE